MSVKIKVKLSVVWKVVIYYMMSTFIVCLRKVTHGLETITMVGHTY